VGGMLQSAAEVRTPSAAAAALRAVPTLPLNDGQGD
jgi:hypothetical protein